jgi:hypothetical protein
MTEVPSLKDLAVKSIQELAAIHDGLRLEIARAKAELVTVKKAVETKEHERLRAELAELNDAVRNRQDYYDLLKEKADGELARHDQILASLESMRKSKEELQQWIAGGMEAVKKAG